MDHALSVSGLGKRYPLATAHAATGFPGYRTLRESLARAARAPFRWLSSAGPPPAAPEFWALRDVGFDIRPGEVVGLIGRNGAGKSTLLRILSRITPPTTGEARIRGRVGSLLEVGTSFHPELTGRENIHLNAAILGMRRREIRRRFDEIVAFAEVEAFLDVPVKRYSSGMFIRLAFSVAAHLDPDVLLIDEVLAVGDAAFQRKCLGRMESGVFSGRTLLFVSHNLAALQRLCSRAIWLDRGRVLQDGPAGEVVAAYLRTSFAPVTERVFDGNGALESEDVRVERAAVRPASGLPSDPVSVRSPVVFECAWRNRKPGAALTLVLEVHNAQGILVFRSASVHEKEWHGRPLPEGGYRTTCAIPGDLLNAGTHYVELAFRRDEGLVVLRHDDLLTFEVLDDPERRGDCHGEWPGAVRPALEWRTERLDRAP